MNSNGPMYNGNGYPNQPYSRPPKKKLSTKVLVLIIIACYVAIALIGNVIAYFIGAYSSLGKTSAVITDSNSLGTVPGDSTDDYLSKTIMVYMDGADLELKCASSTTSITEMLESGLDFSKVNVLVYTGGSDIWKKYDIPTDKDCIYILKDGKLNLLKEYKPKNMGKCETLETFMSYCIENYPAQQYGLILSNHGGGPNHGICFDLRNNHDSLSMWELQTAFDNIGFGGDEKMEFIIFEACLMASVETAHCMSNYANYMIASENVSYTIGSDYSFVECLNRCNSGADVGQEFVSRFYKKSADNADWLASNGKGVYDVTYSCFDLSKIGDVEEKLDALFREINKGGFLVDWSVSYSGSNARGVGVHVNTDTLADNSEYQLIDLVDWVSNLSSSYDKEVEELISAVDEMVVHNKASTEHMHGATVFFPYTTKGSFTYDSFGFSKEYTKYLKYRYDTATTDDNTSRWDTISSISEEDGAADDEGGLSIELTEEQAQSFARAEYYILAKYDEDIYHFEEDQYVVVTKGNDVELDDNGKLSATYDRLIHAVIDENGNAVPILSTLTRNKTYDGDIEYSFNCGLQYVPDESEYPGERDEEGLNALAWVIENMRLDAARMTAKIVDRKIQPVCGELVDNEMPSRILIDINDYQTIQFTGGLYKVKLDEDSRPLPASEWECDTTLLGNSYDIDGLKMEMVDIEDMEEAPISYYATMIITDIYGNQYSTSLEEIEW